MGKHQPIPTRWRRSVLAGSARLRALRYKHRAIWHGKTEAAAKTIWRRSQRMGRHTRKRLKATELYGILKRQQYKCALTGIELTPETAAVDHIVPISKGGPDTVRNIQWLHRDVNRLKGALSTAELIRWCDLILKHTSRQRTARKR